MSASEQVTRKSGMFAQTSNDIDCQMCNCNTCNSPDDTTITMSERRQSVVGEVVSLVFLGLSVLLSYKWYKKMFKEPVNNKLVHVLPHTHHKCAPTLSCALGVLFSTHTHMYTRCATPPR